MDVPVRPTRRHTRSPGNPSGSVRALARPRLLALLLAAGLAAQPALPASVDDTGGPTVPSATQRPADGRADYRPANRVPESSAPPSRVPCAPAGDVDTRAGNACEPDAAPPVDRAAVAPDGTRVASDGPDGGAADALPESVFGPIPLQIVSPGVSVNVEIVTRHTDGPVSVTVDRLPDDAAMVENADGTHTFRWLTGLDDQGEHVFRFTATHGDGETVIDTRNVTILVGDPSLGGSYPARRSTDAR